MVLRRVVVVGATGAGVLIEPNTDGGAWIDTAVATTPQPLTTEGDHIVGNGGGGGGSDLGCRLFDCAIHHGKDVGVLTTGTL